MMVPQTRPANIHPSNIRPAKPAVFILLLFFTGTFLLSAGPFWFDLETGAAFTGYNNVQIPADTGTRFSLADDLDPGTVWYYRIRGGVDIGRHSISLLYAPLKVKSSGSAGKDIEFVGETFPLGTPLEGT